MDDEYSVWVMEPLRMKIVEKYSGTLTQSLGNSLSSRTMNAFAHFSYDSSDGNLVLVDLQCEYSFPI